MVFGIGYNFWLNGLFRFLNALRTITCFYLGLGFAKDEAPHSESFYYSSNTNRIKRSTYFLKVYACTFITGYGLEHIGFESSFNLKCTGSVFKVSSVPLNKSSKFCASFSNLKRCVVYKCWHWVSMTLCKSDFSYLAYNITRNNLVTVRTFSDSYKLF